MSKPHRDITELIEVTPDLVVTVVENATVFEGSDSVYRYDLTASGIVEGWAVQAVLDQVKLIHGATWPNIEVAVDAKPEVAHVLVDAFLNKGVGAYLVESEPDFVPPRVQDPSPEPRRWLHPLHLALAVVVLATGAVSWWAISRGTSTEAVLATAHEPESEATSSAPASTLAAPTPSSTLATPTVLENGHLRVQLPSGFRLSAREDGMVMATGHDQDLRILLSSEYVGELPPEHVKAEVERMVEADPALIASTPLGIDRGAAEVAYIESPGDGSQVGWSVWVQDGHMYSVGCHSRLQPTLAQKSACRMAAATISLVHTT